MPEARPGDGPSEDLHRPIVGLPVHGVRGPVLPSVGEGEPGRIPKRGRGPVEELRDEGQGPQALRPKPRRSQEGREVLGPRLVGGEEDGTEPPGVEVGEEEGVPLGKPHRLKTDELVHAPVGGPPGELGDCPRAGAASRATRLRTRPARAPAIPAWGSHTKSATASENQW